MKTLLTPFFVKLYVKMPMVFKAFGSKKAIVLVPVTGVTLVVSMKWSLTIFFLAYFFDFVTGIIASVYEHKMKKKKQCEIVSRVKLFFETISSEKLRLSVNKLMGYLITILLLYGIERVFYIKSFSIKISEAQFTITTVLIGLWTAFECYSIFFENFPRMGFDISDKLSKLINKYKSTKKQIEQ